MGKINISMLTNAPVEEVFAIGRTIYSMVEFLPNIKAIDIIKESGDRNYSCAEWILDLKLPVPHGKLSWVQEAFWDIEGKFCKFRLSPDYGGIVKRFDGFLFFKPTNKGSEMKMDIDFRVEHPLVSPYVQMIFDGIMKKNNESLLKAIKKKAESGLRTK